MSEFGDRLKAERIRLGYNQEDFGAIGGVARNAQSNYESNKRVPDAAYLKEIAGIQADVQYIVTGQRPSHALTDYLTESEATLIKAYRNTDQAHQDTVLQVCDAVAAKYEMEYAPSNTVTFSSENDHMISQRLRIERERVGLTPEQLIEKNMMGIDLDNYVATEHNEINPIRDWTGLEFAALAALGMDVRYILIGERSLIVPDKLVSTDKD
jgi:transcriptional regulator with XRE-family HTH domain